MPKDGGSGGRSALREADLYAPLKAYLQAQGYEVKAEIGDCDIFARRGDEPPVVVEMKLTFSLALVMQGVARLAVADTVYLAVPVSSERGWSLRYRDILALCRRLGLGLLAVDPGQGLVTAHLDPAPYAPRKNTAKATRLLREFERRVGDPNTGGTTKTPRMTAYRQDALRCAAHLAAHGPATPARIAKATGTARAATLLRADHYGWFDRPARGLYALSPKGQAALHDQQPGVADLLAGLSPTIPPSPFTLAQISHGGCQRIATGSRTAGNGV
ncbi:hypothetical protein GEU84_005225 [Fertoebacter nigrum]|uniref:DUF2161 domain-containing phosphodiesterase n=1 Tax=Fertoeibacter niger TaxID=2656921 RepID=A0A8X8H1E2_9RHOB|nr:DUF2161 family putative PD-(D/E)XK-type phosphodiesterase [Fertoeibacter niger]NUB43778.1 hypothetical protein [Fertoeibacter niger]